MHIDCSGSRKTQQQRHNFSVAPRTRNAEGKLVVRAHIHRALVLQPHHKVYNVRVAATTRQDKPGARGAAANVQGSAAALCQRRRHCLFVSHLDRIPHISQRKHA
jgi:hypothetical protein